jgi:hypothetical protein
MTGVVNAAIAVARWLATKGLLLFLMYVALPIVLYNVLVHYGSDLYAYILGKVSESTGSLSTTTIQLTGLGGWIGAQLGIVSMFSAYMSAVSTRFTIDLVTSRFM